VAVTASTVPVIVTAAAMGTIVGDPPGRLALCCHRPAEHPTRL